VTVVLLAPVRVNPGVKFVGKVAIMWTRSSGGIVGVLIIATDNVSRSVAVGVAVGTWDADCVHSTNVVLLASVRINSGVKLVGQVAVMWTSSSVAPQSVLIIVTNNVSRCTTVWVAGEAGVVVLADYTGSCVVLPLTGVDNSRSSSSISGSGGIVSTECGIVVEVAAGAGESTSLVAPVGVNSWVKLVGKVAVVRASSGSGVVSVSSESTVSSTVVVGVVGTSEAANTSESSTGGVGVS
jgi:hypothetical protein